MVNHGFFPEHKGLIDSKAVKIPNGYDPDHSVAIDAKKKTSNQFSIRYFGSLKANQHPGAFINALSEIELNHPDIAKEINFEFYGSIDPQIQKEISSVTDSISSRFNGFISHDEMMSLVSDTSLLLLVIGMTKNSKFALSTKVFEYMLSGNPVLGIGPTDGAAADLVKKTQIGSFFEREDVDGIKDFILNNFETFKKGDSTLSPNHSEIEKYSFEQLTTELESQMNELISKS
jgi:glycosyltransferase involved in cell wall biosynthesis